MSGWKQYIELWEKVSFDKNGHAIRWERSYDKGVTWKDVDHYFKVIPFVSINATGPCEILQRKLEEITFSQ